MKTNYPIFQIIDVVRIKRKDFEITTKDKECYVISCRLSGESSFFFENKKETITSGDVLYIPLGSTYSQYSKEEEIVFIHLNVIGNAPDNIKIVSPKNKTEVCKLFVRICELWNTNQQFYECMKLLYEILSNTGIVFMEESDDDYLSKIMTYIDEHICDCELFLDEACRSSNICRVYFNKLFKNKYNETPIQYIHKKRIERAKFLLQSGSYSREEIANLCGFNDVKYFYSVFKSVTGLTTGEYRKSNKNIKVNISN